LTAVQAAIIKRKQDEKSARYGSRMRRRRGEQQKAGGCAETVKQTGKAGTSGVGRHPMVMGPGNQRGRESLVPRERKWGVVEVVDSLQDIE